MAVSISKAENTLFVEKGKVVRAETWVVWNGQPWRTITIERIGLIYKSEISDPEHGGCRTEGSLEEVTKGLHPDIRAEYQALFRAAYPDVKMLEAIGFAGYTLQER